MAFASQVLNRMTDQAARERKYRQANDARDYAGNHPSGLPQHKIHASAGALTSSGVFRSSANRSFQRVPKNRIRLSTAKLFLFVSIILTDVLPHQKPGS
jgi:hypothetical protein